MAGGERASDPPARPGAPRGAPEPAAGPSAPPGLGGGLAAPAGADPVHLAILALLEERQQRARPENGEQRSTIQVRPQLHWPTLGDDDHDVELFIEEFEEVVGLANNGMGMNFREKLRVLGAA